MDINIASIRKPSYNISIDMETVTLSSKFQIMIPKGVREQLQLKPGERFHVVGFGDRVELIPVRSIEQMRGILAGRGIEADIEREEDRL